jgi:hypothetical protein
MSSAARIRAKFRCMRTSQHHTGYESAQLQPVYRGTKSPDGLEEENRAFWTATPSGEIEFWWQPWKDPQKFEAGCYYYVDFEEDADGPWHVESKKLKHQAAAEVSLVCWGESNGRITLGISNPAAVIAMGDVGSKWRVTFSFAEPSGD